MNWCHSSRLNRWIGPFLSLLSRTATSPTGRQATSTQSPLAVLTLDFLHVRPRNSAALSPLYAERDHPAEGPGSGFSCRRTVSSRIFTFSFRHLGFDHSPQTVRPKPTEKSVESAHAIAPGLEPRRKEPGRRAGTGECRPHLRNKGCSGVAQCSPDHGVLYVRPADLQGEEGVITCCGSRNRDIQSVTLSSRKSSQDSRT
jgi:hypothetical protein